jgi:hypothetical protein
MLGSAMAGEHSNKPPGSVKGGYIHGLANYELLKLTVLHGDTALSIFLLLLLEEFRWFTSSML